MSTVPSPPVVGRSTTRRTSVTSRRQRNSAGDRDDKSAMMHAQLEQSRALRQKMLADTHKNNQSTKTTEAITMLQKDLAVLTEVLSHISWEERREDDIVLKRKGTRRNPHGGRYKERRMTVGGALRLVNTKISSGESEGVDRNKTIAFKLSLGEDAINVDILMGLVERRRGLGAQVSASVLQQIGLTSELFKIKSTGGVATTPEGETRRLTMNTTMPLRNRASSAEGRYSVPTESQCSAEVRNLLKISELYSSLIKGFYTTRSVRDGVWTAAMMGELKRDVAKTRQRKEWIEKREAEMLDGFYQILGKEEQNKGLQSLKTLKSRETVTKTRLQSSEHSKMTATYLSREVGHLRDTVSMLQGALTSSLGFFQTELQYLSPLINESAAISHTLRETVETVTQSSIKLKNLFSEKGKELKKLEKKDRSEEADREQLQVERNMWARRMHKLETQMAARTKMARCAAASVKSCKAGNEELLMKVSESTKKIGSLKADLESSESRVEMIYDTLQSLTSELNDETNTVKGKTRELDKLRYLLGEKKKTLHALQEKAKEKRGSRVRVDIEKDFERMQLRMKHLKKKEEGFKEELGSLDQRLFELELNAMEFGYASSEEEESDVESVVSVAKGDAGEEGGEEEDEEEDEGDEIDWGDDLDNEEEEEDE
ncbi:hypothetical protein TrLO_g13710 [Triparma laevis f. longispina]|uniref:Uncharacterized protein n=1 Tax=Triparma laevis f. longispina TaxID=1714387 RepID=A0A9W7E791_9STRA|nr:hypothetical protein TrLO_g13710 [Triparma laevis f. longispina]